MTGDIVTVDDLRKLRDIKGGGYCIRGAKLWSARHGIDFAQFVREGIPAERLLATGDQLAIDLVSFSRQERGDG